MSDGATHLIAVVGAGPAGIFGSRELAQQGFKVVLFNRDIKPGGLAEYGIYPDKLTMKEGLRRQFDNVLETPGITYYGNVKIGGEGELSLDDLRALGFQAILVTLGAQGTKKLGIPGEELQGVYHAKDVVYHYNKLPPYSEWEFQFGRRCAIIGAGNVMVDVARFLIRERKVDEVVSVVRRGPGEVNFTREEMKHIIANLDLQAFEAEMQRVQPALRAVNQSPEIGRHKVLDALPKADPKFSDTRLRFEFLTSPARMLGDNGMLQQVEVEDNILLQKDGVLRSQGTGRKRLLQVETVIFAIGDRVDSSIGLPVAGGEFVKAPMPRYPIEKLSYEAFDPGANQIILDVFLGGWARKASEGLVGLARKDGINAAKAVEAYLETLPTMSPNMAAIEERLKHLPRPLITSDELDKLEAVERAEALRRGVPEFKFSSNEEMQQAIGLAETAG